MRGGGGDVSPLEFDLALRGEGASPDDTISTLRRMPSSLVAPPYCFGELR